ncbi:DNRLRE domain-containing protein [Crocinitomicaceae bacterium CZZ-1]|uniref:DNRLRE domain-containing protein n=1 Tax=Taishania pollutisoli TaxID=2766479 RepID=A0A8J6P648_9FLAO|nr:DNRLRE domain-containing protein [Taishania pollutisoli]MBC9812572.1 DNRLRE domain-containing protein [Taishania pollutisoli]MBX2949270.1 DNRLRE domain-containing protein [Crocinitomicaceae bacterium]NGF77142.1 DNRLRE domain-containing protein [Fluviicola sp. SGL-29]
MKLILLLLGLFSSLTVFSQTSLITTTEITSDKSTSVHSASATANPNSSSVLVGRYAPRATGDPYTTYRTLVEFSTSIPSNAIITSAKLKMYISTTSGTPTIYAARLSAPWSESTAIWANQPAYETSDIITTSSIVSNWLTFDVTSHVQKMNANVYTNNGWILYLSNETQSLAVNRSFASDDALNTTQIPKLEVTYYIPMSVSSVEINHQSADGTNDGSIVPLLADGPGGTYSYQWYNGPGTMMPGKTSLELTDIPYGWYGLRVTSSIVGTEAFYYSFLVGKKGEEVTITYNPDGNFIDDASLYSSFLYYNYGVTGNILAEEVTTTNDIRGLLRFRLWLDPAFTMNEASLYLSRSTATASSGSNNTVRLNRVNNDWGEMTVTHSSMPNSSSTEYLEIAHSTITSLSKIQLDALSQFQTWQQDNISNYGWLVQLLYYNNISKYQRFYSSDHATASYRPYVRFKIKVEEDTELVWSHGNGVDISVGQTFVKKNTQSVAVPYCRSKNILYARNEYGYKNGGIGLKIGNVTDDLKKIGFDVISDSSQTFNEIDYGISFVDSKLYFFNADSTITLGTFVVNDSIALERFEDSIFVTLNGSKIHQLLVDPYEVLQIEAQLISAPSSFSHLTTSISSKIVELNTQIDNVNNLIYLDTLENYLYNWEDGDIAITKHNYLENLEKIKVRDNLGNTIDKEYGVGEPIVWGSFNKSQVVNNDSFGQGILEFFPLGPGIFGTAKSTSVFTDQEDHWVSYVTDDQTVFRGFGIISQSGSFSSISNAPIGISFENKIAIITSYTNKLKEFSYNPGDVFSIFSDQENRTWNVSVNGIIMHSMNIPTLGNLVIGGVVIGGSKLKNMSFSHKNYDALLTTTWVDSLNTGRVAVNLNQVSGLSGNVSYIDGSSLIIPPLPYYVSMINTSLDSNIIDSASFCNGSHSYTTPYVTYNDVPGKYYVSSYDNAGKIIFQKEIYNAPNLLFSHTSGVVQDGKRLVSNSTKGTAIIGRESMPTATMNLQVSKLLRNEGITVGFYRGEKILTDFSDVDEGFKVSNGILSVINKGELKEKNYKINDKSTVSILRKDGFIEFILNDISILKKPLSISDERYLTIEINGINGFLELTALPSLLQWVNFYKIHKTPSNCYSGEGNLNFMTSNVAYSDMYQTHHVTAIRLYDSNDNLITPSTTLTIPSVTIANTSTNEYVYNYEHLLPGTYHFEVERYYVANGSGLNSFVTTTTIVVEIDSRIIWTNLDDAIYQSADESLTSTDPSILLVDLESAESKNVVGTNYPYYVDFEIKQTGSYTNILFIGFEDQSFNSMYPTVGLGFVTYPASNQLGVIVPGGSNNTIPLNTKFRLQLLSPTQARLFRKHTFWNSYSAIGTTFSFSSPDKLVAFVNRLNCGFKNVSSNLPCPERTIYAKLERRLTGEKYKVYLDKVQFYYDQEYHSSSPNLNYKIYKAFDPVTPVMTGTTNQEDVTFGDNRYKLNVSQLQSGEYILEVINDKSEKFYLRFQII